MATRNAGVWGPAGMQAGQLGQSAAKMPTMPPCHTIGRKRSGGEDVEMGDSQSKRLSFRENGYEFQRMQPAALTGDIKMGGISTPHNPSLIRQDRGLSGIGEEPAVVPGIQIQSQAPPCRVGSLLQRRKQSHPFAAQHDFQGHINISTSVIQANEGVWDIEMAGKAGYTYPLAPEIGVCASAAHEEQEDYFPTLPPPPLREASGIGHTSMAAPMVSTSCGPLPHGGHVMEERTSDAAFNRKTGGNREA